VTNSKPGFYLLSPGNGVAYSSVSVRTPGAADRALRLNNDVPFTLTNRYCLHIENNKSAKKVSPLALKKQDRQNTRHAHYMLIIKH